MTNPLENANLNLDPPGRGRIYGDITETIGNTPLVRLNDIARNAGAKADVLVKLEFFNPMSSVKDRLAVAMIAAMEADGTIGPGSVIIEPTSGNTGVGLAFVCAAKGYRCILTMPDSFSIERRKMFIALGAELELTPRAEGINGAVKKAEALVESIEGAVMPYQFGHPANPEIHRRTTAEEIWADTGGNVDTIVMGVGTGGTLTGVADVLKGKKPDLEIIAVEPEDSPVISGGSHSPHMIQGIGAGFIPDVLDTSLIDSVEQVSNDDAIDAAKLMATSEGIPCGISSGAAVAVALRLAARDGMAGKTVVAVVPDFAERYISSILFDGMDIWDE